MSVNVTVCFEEEKEEMLIFGKVKTFPLQAHLECFDCFKNSHSYFAKNKKCRSVCSKTDNIFTFIYFNRLTKIIYLGLYKTYILVDADGLMITKQVIKKFLFLFTIRTPF